MKKIIIVAFAILLTSLCGCDSSHNEKRDIGKENFDKMLETSNQKVTGKLDANPINDPFDK